MDSVARYNQKRWEELCQAGIDFSKPMLDLTEESAWKLINEEGISLEVRGKDVLCLSMGGGQQSAAFGVLGANVTVFDLSENMLKKDVETAKHYGFQIRVEQGDMRDLGVFGDGSFDIVWGASIDFVPDVAPVIQEVARVLRQGGQFYMGFSNPYFMGVYEKYDRAYQEGRLIWDGYSVTEPYIEGAEIKTPESFWEVWQPDGKAVRVEAPRTYRHTLGRVINLLVQNDLRLLGLWEPLDETESDPDPGSWGHWVSLAPVGISLWALKE